MKAQSGYTSNGLPYAKVGSGSKAVVIFTGSELESKPPSGVQLKALEMGYKGLAERFTVWQVGRRPNPPRGYTAQQMSDDFAEMIRADVIRTEIGAPVHVMGISSGGSSALHFAVDHPDLLDRLVLAMTAHRMGEYAVEMSTKAAAWARAGDWASIYEFLGAAMAEGMPHWLIRPIMRTFGTSLFGRPTNPEDFAVVLESDIALDVDDKVQRITAPTLIIAGDRDAFYPAEIIRELATCIPNNELYLIPNAGHSVVKTHTKLFMGRIEEFLA